MKNKTIKLICIVVVVLLSVFSVLYIEKLHKERKQEENYSQAITDYKNGNFNSAYFLLSDLPQGYKNRDSIYQELIKYKDIYQSALSLIADGDYDNGVKKLNELPNEYQNKNLIIDNINKIKKLVENTWYNDPIDYDWYYETTFSVSTYAGELTLYIFEDEYSGHTFMNSYTDSANLIDLLKYNRTSVLSDERDNFDLDITSIESNEYISSTSYVTSTYKIKETTTSSYKRPNCIVDGCLYKADTSIIGFSGKTEYYCNEHYEQMSELANDMLGIEY